MESTASLIFKGVDQLSGPVQSIDNNLKKLEGRVGSIQQKLGAFGSVVRGFFTEIGRRAFDGLISGAERLIGLIPKLIGLGQTWVSTVKQVSDETGLSAEKASVLAVQAQQLGVPIESLDTLFARFTQNIQPNSKLIEALGVSVQTAGGQTRDAASIFYDLQRALAGNNDAVDKAAILAKLFGRNWKEATQLLQASPELLDAIAQHAQASGQVVSQSGLDAATTLERTQTALRGSITGLGTSIFTSIAPALTGVVNAIRAAIDANMTQIAAFVSQVVGFVVGAVSGLFGLNLQASNFAATSGQASSSGIDLGNVLKHLGDTASATDPKIAALQQRIKGLDDAQRNLDRREATRSYEQQRQKLLQDIQDARRGSDAADGYTRSINHQIDAIDAQIAAMDRRSQQQDEEKQRADLVGQISDLESQLEDMKSQAVFTAGMTALQAELARQAHAAQIQNQEKQISDAKSQLADHDNQVAQAKRRQDLEDEKSTLQKKLQLHQQEVQDAKRVSDALQQLRDLDHQRQIALQRQSIDDQKRYLQQQIDNIKQATKNAGSVGNDLWKKLLGGGKDINPSSIISKWNPTGSNSPFGDLSQSIKDGQQAAKDLMIKIDGLITEFQSLWTTWKPVFDTMGQVSKGLLDALGPNGFVLLLLGRQFGIIQLLIGQIPTVIGTLLKNIPWPGRTPTTTPPGTTPPGTGPSINPENPKLPEPKGPGVGTAVTVLALAVAAGNAEYKSGPNGAYPVDAPPPPLNDYANYYWEPNVGWQPVPGKSTNKFVPDVNAQTGFKLGFTPDINSQTGFNLGQSPGTSGTNIPSNTPRVNSDGASKVDIGADAKAFLSTIATQVSPGGQFFQQHYDVASNTSQTADDTSRGADAAETTRDNTTAQVSKWDKGIGITGNVPVVNASTGFTTNVGNTPSVTVGNTPGVNVANTPSVNSATGFTTNVGNTPTVNAATGFTVNVGNTPAVNVGTPTVQSATGFAAIAKNDTSGFQVTFPTPPTVRATGPNGDTLAKDGTPLPIKGVDVNNGGLSVLTESGNNMDVTPSGAFPISKINAAIDIGAGNQIGVTAPSGGLPVQDGSAGIVVHAPGIAANTFPLTKIKINAGRLDVITSGGGTATGGGDPGKCFVYDTPVYTPDGMRPIGEMRLGDKVYAVDEQTLELVVSEVTHLFPHPDAPDRRLLVTLADGKTIEVTDNHPFYDVERERFRHIAEFVVGDVVLDYAGGHPAEREIVAIVEAGGSKDVYNIEVAIYHNYLAYGVLVHNSAKAMGATGLTSGLTELTVGEAGTEAVAVLRNPRPGSFAALSRGGGAGSAGRYGSNRPLEMNFYFDSEKVAQAVFHDMSELLARDQVSTTLWSK
jgi:Pretoxin HINT domain